MCPLSLEQPSKEPGQPHSEGPLYYRLLTAYSASNEFGGQGFGQDLRASVWVV